jgi:hypothetical protein
VLVDIVDQITYQKARLSSCVYWPSENIIQGYNLWHVKNAQVLKHFDTFAALSVSVLRNQASQRSISTIIIIVIVVMPASGLSPLHPGQDIPFITAFLLGPRSVHSPLSILEFFSIAG